MQLGYSGFSFDERVASQVREEFALRRAAVIPHFLEAGLAADLARLLESAPGAERVYRESDGRAFASDFAFSSTGTPSVALRLLTNDESLLSGMESATGTRGLRSFDGSIFRHFPARDHYLDWHNDCDGTRIIGMSVNLSTRPYQGGRFRLRRANTEEVLADIHYTQLGWAHIFEIGPKLEHCVTEIVGSEPRTSYAGWCRTEPDRAAYIGAVKPAERGSVLGDSEKVQGDRFGRAAKAVFQTIADEVMALSFHTGKLARLDPIATEVWREVAECGSIAEARRRLAERYDVDAEVLARDVDMIIGELVAAGLLEPR